MLRGFDFGLLAALGAALVHGVAWSIVGLTFGLLAVGVVGGWLIGYAVKQGVASQRLQTLEPVAVADDKADTPSVAAPRGMSTIAALLGLLAYVAGSFVAFTIVQLSTGQGDLLGRLTPAGFAAFMNALITPPQLQAAVLAAYVVVAWFSARPARPRPANARG